MRLEENGMEDPVKSKRSREEQEPEKLESREIIEIVNEISKGAGNQKDKQRQFRKKYPVFAEGYPVLFEMATRNDFDMARFQYMMNLRDSIDNHGISQYDASAKVGKMLYDTYVKDKIDGIKK